jgi:hypothetical protein
MDNPVAIGPVEIVALKGRLWNKMVASETGIVPDNTKIYGAFLGLVMNDSGSKGAKIRIAVKADLQIDDVGDYVVNFEGDCQIMSTSLQFDKPYRSALVNVEVMVYYNSKEEHLLTKVFVAINQQGVICAPQSLGSSRMISVVSPSGQFQLVLSSAS